MNQPFLKLIPGLIAIVLFSSCQNSGQFMLESPDGNLQLVFDETEPLSFVHLYDSDTLICGNNLKLQVEQLALADDVRLVNISRASKDETWYPVIGKQQSVRNHYNQLQLDLSSSGTTQFKFSIVFRCYNEGFAYRFIIPEQSGTDSVTISGESTSLDFRKGFSFWAYNGERHNIGPVVWSESPDTTYRIPLVAKCNESHYVGIHEAEIIRYAPFELKKDSMDEQVHFKLLKTTDQLPVKTSWRSFIVGQKPGDLVNSNLLANLNEPCKIEDTSWIKPGRSMWDWRVWGYKTDDGFEYGLNTQSHLRFIDFAAENNIQYLLIDADWYGPEFDADSDPTSAKNGIDIERCMAYAKEKGVGVILYLNDVGAKKFGLERILKQFSDWGAVGVKYGFMRGNMEQRVRHTRKVVELCAKYQLMVNFHDNPVPPSGDDRTWPNLTTKEFCHSQADALRSYWPETIVTTTFVNMMAGPIDNCDGWFDFNHSINRVRVFQEIPGTVAAEAAKLIVVYTGINVMPDAPEEYLKKDNLFDCIRKMPAGFDSFKIIDGAIGEYIVVARKAGDDWFVGALTNRNSRVLYLDLSFLEAGVNYTAKVYEDAETTHYLNDRESYQIRSVENVGDYEKLSVKLASGGGCAIHFVKN